MASTSKAIQQDLAGQSFDELAIARIQEYEPPEGYYLALSGGKDSIIIYDLAVRAGVKFDAHFSVTTVDPPEVLKFIKEYYPDVIWERPKMSMYQLIVKKGVPPTRLMRYCCREIKEIHGKKRLVMMGLRRKESVNRRNRKLYEQSRLDTETWYLNPIIDWSNNDVWSYIRSRQIPYCCLYDEGQDRIGCIMCPMQSTKAMKLDAERYPKYYRAYLRTFTRMLKSRPPGHYQWQTAEDVMDWWINAR
jgi:phosphoadenosine phosphosulfate reductase